MERRQRRRRWLVRLRPFLNCSVRPQPPHCPWGLTERRGRAPPLAWPAMEPTPLSDAKARLAAEIDRRADLLVDVSHQIHAHPELGFEERFAHELLTGVLEDEGLDGHPVGPRGRDGLRGPGRHGRAHGGGRVRVRRPARASATPAGTTSSPRPASGGPGGRRAGRRARRAGGGRRQPGRGGRGRQGPPDRRRALSTGVDAAMMVHPADADLLSMDVVALHQAHVTYTGRGRPRRRRPPQGPQRPRRRRPRLRERRRAAPAHRGRASASTASSPRAATRPTSCPPTPRAEWIVRSTTVARLEELKARFLACLQAGADAAGLHDGGRVDRPRVRRHGRQRRHRRALPGQRRGAGPDRAGAVVRPRGWSGSTDMGNVSYAVPSIHPMIQVAPPGVPIHTPGVRRVRRRARGRPGGDRRRQGAGLDARRRVARRRPRRRRPGRVGGVGGGPYRATATARDGTPGPVGASPFAEAPARTIWLPMTVYVSEEYTPAEADVLRRYFTNLDGPVFALVNLPEVVKGALFARYSRSPKSLRRLFLDEFVGDLDIAGDASVDATVGLQRAEELYDRVFFEYGDDSVAQLGGRPPGVRAGVEPADQGARVGPAHVVPRAVHPLHRLRRPPRRPLPLLPRPRGPGQPAGRCATWATSTACSTPTPSMAETHARLLPRALPQAARRQRLRAPPWRSRPRRSTRVRGVLPAAALSNVGIYGTGQAYEALLLRMRAHPLPEARTLRRPDAHRAAQGHPQLPQAGRPHRPGRGRQHLPGDDPRRDGGHRRPPVPAEHPTAAASRRASSWSTSTPTARSSWSRRCSTPTPTCPSRRSRPGSARWPSTSGWRSCGPTSATAPTAATGPDGPSSAPTTASTCWPTTGPSATSSATAC